MKFKNWLLLLLCCLCSPVLQGQETVQFIRSFPVPEQLAVSSDAQGNILLSTSDGEIQKFSPQGKLLYTYSPASATYFSSLDGRSAIQLRAFDENSQQLIYLDRFLNQSGSIQLPPEHFNFISALGFSASGNTIWFYDAADMQLKKWRTDTRQLVSALKLNQWLKSSTEVKRLYEHQHKLYLLIPENLLVFDQLGNFERILPLPECTGIAFSGEELLCLSRQNTIEFIQLYTGKRKSISLPAGKTYHKILAINGELYLFSDQLTDVYRSIP